MSTDAQNPPTYAMSEIPEFIIRSKKPELTLKELEYQCQKLGEENHQLQLRILGVNELARLLQDRNELVALLKERNKRLEMSLVRLENRCATFERQVKSQKNSSMPSIKQGQSPFIPGPSPKILEGLMQENLELKKAVNSLLKKGSSGYLEAVKTTQLEEFIEQQRLEIDQLRGQINSLTASASEEEIGGIYGGGMSLPASVTDSGPLRRQLLKMQQTMTVKDRFCTLLSQQVTELQKKLTSLHSENKSPSSAGREEDSSSSTTTNTTMHDQETAPHSRDNLPKESLPEYQKMLEGLKSSLMSSKEKITELEGNVKNLNEGKEDMQEKLECTSQLYSTLLSDNSELRDEVKSLKSQSSKSEVDGDGGGVQRLKSEIRELQKTMDGQVGHYTTELKNKNLELNSRRIELEEANIKFAKTDSVLMSHQVELRQKEYELKQKESELRTVEAKALELEDSVSILNSHNSELQRDVMHFESEWKKMNTYTQPISSFTMKTGGVLAPNLIGGGITPGLESAKDSLPAGLKCRNPEIKSGSTSSNVPQQQHPPQQHVSQQHVPQQHQPQQHVPQQHQPHISQQQHGQLSKPPGPLHIPPPAQHMPMNSSQRRSPGPQQKSHHIGATPTGSTHPSTPMGRPTHSNTTPTPMGPAFIPGQGYNMSRSTSTGPHVRSVATMPISTYSGSPSPRVGTPSSGMGMLPAWAGLPYGGGGGGGGMGVRYASTPGNQPRVTSSSGAPPLPPRSSGGYPHPTGGQAQQVFGMPHSNFPPLPRPQQQPFLRQDPGYPYYTDMRDRDRNTGGSTSPHPPHDNPSMHPYGGGPNNGPGSQPPHY